MEHVTYTNLRQKLSHYMDEAINSSAPILVTRQNGKGNVILVSAEEFAGMEETLHLLRSPANARHLLHSIESADAGLSTEQMLQSAKDKIPT